MGSGLGFAAFWGACIETALHDLNAREQDLRCRGSQRHQGEVGDGGIPYRHLEEGVGMEVRGEI